MLSVITYLIVVLSKIVTSAAMLQQRLMGKETIGINCIKPDFFVSTTQKCYLPPHLDHLDTI